METKCDVTFCINAILLENNDTSKVSNVKQTCSVTSVVEKGKDDAPLNEINIMREEREFDFVTI